MSRPVSRISRTPSIFAAALAACCVSVAPSASGAEAECALIADALVLMTKSPIVLQTDVRSDFPGAIETIYTADAFYVSAGGRWKKVDVTGETRVRQFVDLLARSPFRDCEADGVDTVEGVDAAVYRYTQGPAEQAVNMRVWIGQDGLPYKWASGPVASTMRYQGVAVPRL